MSPGQLDWFDCACFSGGLCHYSNTVAMATVVTESCYLARYNCSQGTTAKVCVINVANEGGKNEKKTPDLDLFFMVLYGEVHNSYIM